MLKKIRKISVLTLIAALFVFAFACTVSAVEPEEEQLVQPVEAEAPDLPVGGWAPAEPIYVPTDLVVNGSGSPGKVQSSKNRINADPNNVFTKGVSSNGYNALNEGQKSLYRAIDAAVIEFMNAEKDLQPTEIELEGQDVERYIVGDIDYTQMGITGKTVEACKQSALRAFYAYDYDHPAYYWISNEVLYNEECIYPCTEAEYAGVSTRRALNTLVSENVKVYADLAATGTDTLDKAALVHDKIINDIDYAYQSDGTTPESARWAHGVHGVFDPKYKSAVCEGYADAFALIMNYMEIPNYYIVGDAGAGGPGGGSGHAWNAFYDEAAERYLYMDLTWDDSGADGYSYAHFGMPLTNFDEEHHEYTSEEYTQDGTLKLAKYWLYDIPGTYNDSFGGTYYNRGGFFYDKNTSGDAEAFATAVKAKAARAGGWVSVMCPDEESVGMIATALGVDGLYYIATYKDDEGDNYNYAYLMAPVGGSHTHAWSEPKYTWSPDNSKASALRICSAPNCDIIAETETVNINPETTEATCTKDGKITYSPVFTNENFSVEPKEVTIEAIGHNWGEPTYEWADDNSTVTAKRVCQKQTEDSCTETETTKTSVAATTAATCTEDGQGTFTAAFANAAFANQTKEGVIKATGHNWGEPAYEWADDNSTVTAKRVCRNQTGESCTETEEAKTTSAVTKAATYTAKGQTTYTATFANPAFEAHKVVTNIPMLAKKANPMKVKAATKTVKVKKLKKKALTVQPLTVTSAKGKVTYKLVSGNAKSKKALKLNTKTGKVTVKKKTKKGTYKIKVKVTAAGATEFKALSKTVTVTVKAK